MFKLTCPSCGADVHFKSKASVFAVCSYCKSILLRQDLDVYLYGKMSEIQEDLTPFQLGTSGLYEGKRFEMLGRLKMAWQEGYWNEWYVLFSDQREGWLAEAQGFYAISFELKSHSAPALSKLKVGQVISLGEVDSFQVDDIKEAVCRGSEGELPFPAPIGRKAISVDLVAPEGQFANIEYADGGVRCYRGQYVDFDDFKFNNLRELEGW